MAPHPDLWLFATLVFGVIVLPGMDMAFVAGSTLAAGWRAGLAAVAGIIVAGQVHLLAALVGLAALLLWWPGARVALLLAGAAYMAWIGYDILRSTRRTKDAPAPSNGSVGLPPASLSPAGALGQPAPGGVGAYFFRAAATCLMNPKAYAFTLAVLPSFLHSAERSTTAQALWLGGIIATNQALVYGAVALMAAGARPWLARSDRAQRWMARVVGALLVAAAVAMAAGAAQAAPATAPTSTTSPANPRSPAMSPALSDTAVLSPALAAEAAHDFDFLIGHWQGRNRKLRTPLSGSGAAAADWEEFDTELDTVKLPDGIGNADRFVAPAWRPGYMGSTLRVFNPRSGLWSLYSFDTRGNGFDEKTGALLPPVVGRFHGDEGVFEGPDDFHGRPILVRYHWTRTGPDSATWAQSFSADGGKTWEENWRCEHQRMR